MAKPRTFKEGRHEATISHATVGISMSGSERIEVYIHGEDGERIRRDLYVTPRARKYTFETLESFGLDTSTDAFLDDLDKLKGRRCVIVVALTPGAVKTAEVVRLWPHEEDRVQPSEEELKARFRERLAEKPPADPPLEECVERPQS